MKLNTMAVGSASGLLWGMGAASITLFVSFFEKKMSRKPVIGRVFRRHMISPRAGAVAFLLGLVDGFVGGAVFSSLYNGFVSLFSGKRKKYCFFR